MQQIHHQQQTAATNSLSSAVSAVRNKGKRKSSSQLSAAMHSLPPHTLQTQLDKMLTDRMLNLAESQKKFVAEQTASIFYGGGKQHNKATIATTLPADLSVDYSASVKTNGELHQNNNNNHRNNNNSSPGGHHIKTERLSPVGLAALPTQTTTKNGDCGGGGANRRSR